ncbi:GNAT family N-acetyltransferase [Streptomyces sp. NPDC005438]|uniref:bifunctional acetate--CoA ligase family protein/GNAT family N-acetyltransferase n=1 Tax=Streptomyces sp. NPDC005438 TaxID=3156880 RepID=UPI00339F2393
MDTPVDRAYPTHWEADVVLRDGGTARIRPITPDDAKRLVDFYEQVSDESKYFRFFAPYPRLSDRDVHRFTHHDYVDRVGLAVTVGGEFIATVRYDRIDERGLPASAPADMAEVAFLVQDAHQGRGVASTLLEHIAAVARERGIRRFVAELLPANRKMAKVFTDAGYSQQRSFEDGSLHLTLALEPTEKSLAVMHGREQRAEARSVHRLLAPGSVAVVGARRTPDGAGRTVLESLRTSHFTGRVYAVNHRLPEGEEPAHLGGFPAYRSVREVPEPVDLVVLAVPAARVPELVAECGECGVSGLVILAADFDRDEQRQLVHQARALGMRIIGPNAFGLINNAEDVRLNATLSPRAPALGRVGLFTQSGAIGIALLEGLHRRGAGLSSFVSAGNRADVSGNDVLQYWDDDPHTDLALMYLESIGNPRKFTRLTKRTARRKPVVVVRGARHSGSAPPPGHAAPPTRTPDATVSSLLRQSGVILVDTVTELVDVGLLLGHQPVPEGPRVGIVGNSESMCLLTYDACLARSLRPRPPVDLTPAASPEDFRAALSEALASEEVDAVVVAAIPWVGDVPAARLARALGETARESTKPVAVTHLAIEGLEEELAHWGIPAYPAPERVVHPLSEAVRYGQWLREAEHPGRVPEFEVDEPGAAALLDRVTPQPPQEADDPVARVGEAVPSRPLDPSDAATLLGAYGIHPLSALPALDVEAAVRAADQLGYPVALKTTAPHLRHRADLGGVRLDIPDATGMRRAFEELTAAFGAPEELRPVVQAMAPRGVDTLVRASVDPSIGAVLSFGLAGPPSQLLGDVAHRLIPATDREVAELVRDIRSAPILFGWRGARPVDTPALEDLLCRLSLLVDQHPQVVSVELEPVVVASRGLTVLGASVRVAPPPSRPDLGARRLPDY